jgi:hypothetical protein
MLAWVGCGDSVILITWEAGILGVTALGCPWEKTHETPHLNLGVVSVCEAQIGGL